MSYTPNVKWSWLFARLDVWTYHRIHRYLLKYLMLLASVTYRPFLYWLQALDSWMWIHAYYKNGSGNLSKYKGPLTFQGMVRASQPTGKRT